MPDPLKLISAAGRIVPLSQLTRTRFEASVPVIQHYNSLSFTAMVGFVALVGIEIKNSILLVDLTNQLRAEGVGLVEAIERAGRIRFVPIVLTTLTAIGGLLPLAVQGSSLYSPLAQVIIGGLLSSTLLARLVTPVVDQLLAPPIEMESIGELATAEVPA